MSNFEHKVVTDYTNVQSNEHIKVFVRLRPPASKQPMDNDHFETNDDKKGLLTLRAGDDAGKAHGTHKFAFDRVFRPEEDQEAIFRGVSKNLVRQVLRGYNACCFAYGQTGSGKTYSIFGNPADQETRGIIPRSLEHLFFELAGLENQANPPTCKITVSFLEMYCDTLRDLGKAVKIQRELGTNGSPAISASPRSSRRKQLASGQRVTDSPKASGKTLKSTADWFKDVKNAKSGRGLQGAAAPKFMSYNIHEDSTGNVFVKGSEVITVTSGEEVTQLIEEGLLLRATHETKMNAVSSRSHTILIVTVKQTTSDGQTTTGVLNIIDLAGSERLRKSESEGQRLKETLFINASLSALGKVVMALDPTGPGRERLVQGAAGGLAALAKHIPYRDSKLTRLLQNSLGGNAYTVVLATLHPMADHYEECLSTLHFAAHCRNVRNQPRVNRDGATSASKDRLIASLRGQVAQLKRKIVSIKVRAAAQIALLMAEVGIQGQVLQDGRFKLADGRVIGQAIETPRKGGGGDAAVPLTAEAMQEAGLDAGSLALVLGSGGGAGGSLGSARGSVGPVGIQSSISRQVMQARIKPLQDKIRSLRDKVSRLERAAREGSEAASRTETKLMEQIRAKDASHRAEMSRSESDVMLNEAKAQAVVAQTAQQTTQLVANQQTILAQQHGLLRQARAASQAKVKARDATIRKLRLQLARLQQQMNGGGAGAGRGVGVGGSTMSMTGTGDLLAGSGGTFYDGEDGGYSYGDGYGYGCDTMGGGGESGSNGVDRSVPRWSDKDMDRVRAQVKYWMVKRDTEATQLLEEVNSFYAHKRAQVSAYEAELVLLHDTCAKLAALVIDCRDGVLPSTIDQMSGLVRFSMPGSGSGSGSGGRGGRSSGGSSSRFAVQHRGNNHNTNKQGEDALWSGEQAKQLLSDEERLPRLQLLLDGIRDLRLSSAEAPESLAGDLATTAGGTNLLEDRPGTSGGRGEDVSFNTAASSTSGGHFGVVRQRAAANRQRRQEQEEQQQSIGSSSSRGATHTHSTAMQLREMDLVRRASTARLRAEREANAASATMTSQDVAAMQAEMERFKRDAVDANKKLRELRVAFNAQRRALLKSGSSIQIHASSTRNVADENYGGGGGDFEFVNDDYAPNLRANMPTQLGSPSASVPARRMRPHSAAMRRGGRGGNAGATAALSSSGRALLNVHAGGARSTYQPSSGGRGTGRMTRQRHPQPRKENAPPRSAGRPHSARPTSRDGSGSRRQMMSQTSTSSSLRAAGPTPTRGGGGGGGGGVGRPPLAATSTAAAAGGSIRRGGVRG